MTKWVRQYASCAVCGWHDPASTAAGQRCPQCGTITSHVSLERLAVVVTLPEKLAADVWEVMCESHILGSDVPYIILECSNAPLTSQAVGALIALNKKVSEEQKRLFVVVEDGLPFREALRLSQVDKVLEVFPTVDDVLARFGLRSFQPKASRQMPNKYSDASKTVLKYYRNLLSQAADELLSGENVLPNVVNSNSERIMNVYALYMHLYQMSAEARPISYIAKEFALGDNVENELNNLLATSPGWVPCFGINMPEGDRCIVILRQRWTGK